MNQQQKQRAVFRNNFQFYVEIAKLDSTSTPINLLNKYQKSKKRFSNHYLPETKKKNKKRKKKKRAPNQRRDTHNSDLPSRGILMNLTIGQHLA